MPTLRETIRRLHAITQRGGMEHVRMDQPDPKPPECNGACFWSEDNGFCVRCGAEIDVKEIKKHV